MALPISWYSQTIADNTVRSNGQPETTSWSVPVAVMTPANAAAQETAMGSLRAAVQGIILGNTFKYEEIYVRSDSGATPAASALAQRENKWLMRYHDAVNGQKFQVSVGTADLTKKMTNSEFVDLSTGAGATLKTAFEAVVVSPNDGSHAVVLDSVQFVGRNT